MIEAILTGLGVSLALGAIVCFIDIYARLAAHRQEFADTRQAERTTVDHMSQHERRIASLEQTRRNQRELWSADR